MSETNEELQESVEVEETVDFDSSESRMGFLKTQLNDLLDGINNVYGQDLMEELLKRLEKTVESFDSEVSGLIGKLKDGKIFEDDSDTSHEDKSDDLDDDAKHFEDQESEDADIIARMKARHPQE